MNTAWAREAIENFGGQRFVLVVGGNFINTMLIMAGFIDQATFSTMFLASVGAFVAAGTVQDAMQSTNDRKMAVAVTESKASMGEGK